MRAPVYYFAESFWAVPSRRDAHASVHAEPAVGVALGALRRRVVLPLAVLYHSRRRQLAVEDAVDGGEEWVVRLRRAVLGFLFRV